jgi:lipoprotein signal peptidase
MRHVRRLGLGAMFIVAVMILGLVIDTVVYRLLEANRRLGVDETFLSPVLTHLEGAAWSIVPIMLGGIVLWIVYGAVQEERREEQRRRVR